MILSHLLKNDIKEYLSLVSHLSTAEESNYIYNIYDNLKLYNKTIIVCKNEEGKIVGTGSLQIEYKLTHGGWPAAHIEDVVVLPEYRKQGIGKLIINELITLSIEKNCRKILLSCNDNNIRFYKDCGFKLHEVTMRMDI